MGNLSENTSNIINNAIQNNKRIISVGTTSLRILETIAKLRNGLIEPWSGCYGSIYNSRLSI